MKNIERKYAYYDEGDLPVTGEDGVTYLTLYSSEAGNTYDGWIWDPDRIHYSETERTFGYRYPNDPNYCWDDEVIVDLSNAQARQEASEYESGRITSYNTNVSDSPILLEDIDISGLTEAERESKATTVLFTAIPLTKSAYIHAEIEVSMKMNISPDNTNGNVRVEAFYILNNESDRVMRPNPVNHYTVTKVDEYHTMRLMYWNPSVNSENHNYIGVKLLVTGGTAEIGISSNPAYGDAIITVASNGMTGDKIYNATPRSLSISGLNEVVPGYELDPDDYTVLCTYSDGNTFDVTKLCRYSPAMGTPVIENRTILTALYQGLTASMEIDFAQCLYITYTKTVYYIHESYTLDINDFEITATFSNGQTLVVTDECTFNPSMGTTITERTLLEATYTDWEEIDHLAQIYINPATVRNSVGADIIYTYYDDSHLIISGRVDDSWHLTFDLATQYNGLHKADDGRTMYDDTQSFTDSYYVSGHGTSGTPSQNSYTWNPGAGNSMISSFNPTYYFEVNIPDAFKDARTIEYKLQGKPLGLTLAAKGGVPAYSVMYGKLKDDVKFIGFENMDTSKLVSLFGCFAGKGSGGRTSDLSFLKDMDFSNVDDITGAFIATDISTYEIHFPNARYAYRSFVGCYCSDINTKLFPGDRMSNLKVIDGMFMGARITHINFVKHWRLSNVVTSMRMFQGCSYLKDVSAISDWRMDKLKKCAYMFLNCTSIESIFDIFTGWVGNKLVSAKCMFQGCTKLKNIFGIDDLMDTMTDNGNINGLFKGCLAIESLFGVHGMLSNIKIKYTSGLFSGCTHLTDITAAGSWTMLGKVSVQDMFWNCPIDSSGPSSLARWDVSTIVSFQAFMNKAATTASIPDTEHPDPPYHTRVSPSLHTLDAWNVDQAHTNTVNVFGYEYYNGYSVLVFPYINVTDGPTTWHRQSAVSWYIDRNNNDSGIYLWGSMDEDLSINDLI